MLIHFDPFLERTDQIQYHNNHPANQILSCQSNIPKDQRNRLQEGCRSCLHRIRQVCSQSLTVCTSSLLVLPSLAYSFKNFLATTCLLSQGTPLVAPLPYLDRSSPSYQFFWEISTLPGIYWINRYCCSKEEPS